MLWSWLSALPWTISLLAFVLFRLILYPSSHSISSSFVIPSSCSFQRWKNTKIKVYWLQLDICQMFSLTSLFYPWSCSSVSSFIRDCSVYRCLMSGFLSCPYRNQNGKQGKQISGGWITNLNWFVFTIIHSQAVFPGTHAERRAKPQLMSRSLPSNRQGTRFWDFTPSTAVLLTRCVTFSKSLYCISVKYW